MNKNSKYDIAVIGGGASGMISAIAADLISLSKNRICILERSNRIGRKLLATGNGRCNLTNSHINEMYYNTTSKETVASILNTIGYKEVLSFFSNLGLLCKEESNGRVYPNSNQASSVLDVLRNAIIKQNISEKCDYEVSYIYKNNEDFEIISSNNEKIYAHKVILATGGQASPNLGSNGSGYKLAKVLGHSLTKIYPALVPLKCNNSLVKSLQGIRVSGDIHAVVNNQELKKETGEVLFTSYGLSGIPIMQLSHLFGSIGPTPNMQIVIDLLPEFSQKSLNSILLSRRNNMIFSTLETFLIGLFNKKIGYAIIKSLFSLPLSTRTSELKSAQIFLIAQKIKNFEFDIIGDMSWSNAQVSAGGVNLSEFNPNTLESLFVDGLYVCGELLDVFADCGGFNLQWAWSTGIICGRAASCAIQNTK